MTPLCFGAIRECSSGLETSLRQEASRSWSGNVCLAVIRREDAAAPDGSWDHAPPAARRRSGHAEPSRSRLRQRRDMAAYDLERARAARQPENPWRERMELLDRSLATIEDDLRALDATPPLPAFPLPETPITDIEVSAGRAGQRRLHDRTGTVSLGRGDRLGSARRARRSRADPAALGKCRRTRPAEVPAERREALERHLAESAIGLRARPARPRARRRAATGAADAGRSGPPLSGVRGLARLARSLRHLRDARLTAARPFAPKRRAWPRSGTTKRKTATSGRNVSLWPASAWPTSTPRSPDWRGACDTRSRDSSYVLWLTHGMAIRYVFVDEAGNFDFSPHGSRYFTLTSIVLNGCDIGQELAQLRRDLARRGMDLRNGFHATEDRQAVRDEVFRLLVQHDFRIDATIFDKAKTMQHLRADDLEFYKTTWFYHMQYLLPRVVERRRRTVDCGSDA